MTENRNLIHFSSLCSFFLKIWLVVWYVYICVCIAPGKYWSQHFCKLSVFKSYSFFQSSEGLRFYAHICLDMYALCIGQEPLHVFLQIPICSVILLYAIALWPAVMAAVAVVAPVSFSFLMDYNNENQASDLNEEGALGMRIYFPGFLLPQHSLVFPRCGLCLTPRQDPSNLSILWSLGGQGWWSLYCAGSPEVLMVSVHHHTLEYISS